MQIIIDGDGTITQLAAKDLLEDFLSGLTKDYATEDITFVTHQPVNGMGKHIYSESIVARINTVIDNLSVDYDTSHEYTVDIKQELTEPEEEVIFIVIGEMTRQELVHLAQEENIPVYDLEKGLYPVTQ